MRYVNKLCDQVWLLDAHIFDLFYGQLLPLVRVRICSRLRTSLGEQLNNQLDNKFQEGLYASQTTA